MHLCRVGVTLALHYDSGPDALPRVSRLETEHCTQGRFGKSVLGNTEGEGVLVKVFWRTQGTLSARAFW